MPLPATEYTPQVIKTRRPLVVWLIVASATILFVLLIVVAPLAASTNHGRVALTIYRSFSVLCHQLPERSFFIAGHQLAVCSRCTGIYVGFALALLLYPLIRSLRTTVTPPRKWLLLAAVPILIDFSLTFFGVWENTHTSRLFTGLILGGVSLFYVMPGIAELSLRDWRRQGTRPKIATFTLASTDNIGSAPSDYSAPHRRI
jgi:uncharacterized membrane protein